MVGVCWIFFFIYFPFYVLLCLLVLILEHCLQHYYPECVSVCYAYVLVVITLEIPICHTHELGRFDSFFMVLPWSYLFNLLILWASNSIRRWKQGNVGSCWPIFIVCLPSPITSALIIDFLSLSCSLFSFILLFVGAAVDTKLVKLCV